MQIRLSQTVKLSQEALPQKPNIARGRPFPEPNHSISQAIKLHPLKMLRQYGHVGLFCRLDCKPHKHMLLFFLFMRLLSGSYIYGGNKANLFCFL